VNLIVATSTDLFATVAPPGSLAPRPPGEGWSLAGLEVSHQNSKRELGALCVVYFWTRSKVYAEEEVKRGGGAFAAAEVLAKGGSLSDAVKAGVGLVRKGGEVER